MARKKYVSLLEILASVRDQIEDANYAYFDLGNDNNLIAKAGEPIFMEPNSHPLDAMRKRLTAEELGYEKREMIFHQTTLSYIGNGINDLLMEVPHFYEMLVLKQSFPFQEKEWEVVEQAMFLHLLAWFVQEKGGMRYTESPLETLRTGLMEALEEEGMIRVEEDEDAARSAAGYMDNLYSEKFRPMEKSLERLYKPVQGKLIAIPASSADAFAMLHAWEQDRRKYGQSRITWAAKALLYLPFLLVFYLCEKTTNPIIGMTYLSWREYLKPMQKIWEFPIDRMQEAPEAGEEEALERFTYGLCPRYLQNQFVELVHPQDDAMVRKVCYRIFRTLYQDIVNGKITTCSISNPYWMDPAIGRTNLLLNMKSLAWNMPEVEG